MSGAPGVSESVAGLDDIGPTIQGSSSPSNQRLNTTGNKQAGSQIRENNEIIDLESENGASLKKREFKKLSMLPLVFMIFYEVSGGPFGIEDAVGAAGPLLALLGFLVFPLIWSLPEALITAELGSMFPENGGYVYWVSAALGPYWGFQVGWMKWLSGVIDNAVYPGLFLDYLESSVPAFERKLIRMTTELGITTVLTFLNYRGITIVGWVAVILGVNSLVPFVIMGFLAMPKIKPKRWLVGSIKNVNWGLYLNTLFWNLNYWDNISTLTGEMKNPMKTLPKALFCALILVVFAYFFPLITTIGAIPFVREAWNEGYFSDVAKMIGGVWLRTWIQGAAAVSNMGNFVAEMSSDSFQLLGMAECGMLPAFFAKRSRYGTPWVAILFSASGVIAMQWMSFEEIIAAENFLYCIGMLLEFYAFIRLRSKLPRASRPFKVPVGTIGAACICVPPTVLIIVVLYFSTLKVLSISIGAIVLGLLVEPLMRYCKRKNWFQFYNKSEDVGATKPEVDES